MIKLIDNTTAYYGSGFAYHRKLFKVASGAYAGRLIVCYPTDGSTIKMRYADPPYTSWSTAATIISDAANYPMSGMADNTGNIYLAYTLESSHDLVTLKLSFADGNWSVGNRNTIFAGDDNYYPSLYKDQFFRLWVSWTRVSGGNYNINSKNSTDDGMTWGLGETHTGYSIASGSVSAYSQLVFLPSYLHCIYTIDGTSLAHRKFEIAGSLWDSEVELYSGTNLGAEFFGCRSTDLRLGLAFTDEGDLKYKEYDNQTWSGNFNVDIDLASAPLVRFHGGVPYIFYTKLIGTGQDQLYYSYLNNGSFASGQPVIENLGILDKVILYRPQATAVFYDRTSEAADDSAADVYHPDSGKLIADDGDIIYLGQNSKFHQLKITLSTNGAGGSIGWYYWDGSQWKSFTPLSGSYNFDSSPVTVRLWEDSEDIPSDWQTTTVNGSGRFWIRVQALSDFSTAPVGTQITASAEIPQMTILQE